MKPRTLLARLTATLGLFLTPLHPTAAAEANVGTASTDGSIHGRVQNVATGQYLVNARVAVKGSSLVAFTDENGSFRLPRVPGGPAVLEVFYTGLDAQTVTLEVTAGKTINRDIALSSIERYGQMGSTVKLDPFVVINSKMTEGEALATNEQRFAANIKNVVASDAFGDVTEGNIAEFLKFVPGVTADDDGPTPTTVSVRGFDPRLANVSVDGAQLANAVALGVSREFQFKQVSINNVSRIEVTKVPTAANPADSLAGSINMVSKSAFERDRPQFTYRLYVAANGNHLNLGKTPSSWENRSRKIYPGLEFDYALPLHRNFGLIVTGSASKQYTDQNLSTKTYQTGGVGTGASLEKPYLQNYQLHDAARTISRNSFSVRADWRVTPHGVISATLTGTNYRDDNGNFNRIVGVGTNGTSTIANGTPLSFGSDYTIGATGRGTATLNSSFQHIYGSTLAGNIRYRYDNGHWRADAGINRSWSKTWRRASAASTFTLLTTSMLNPIRVSFTDIGVARPGRIQLFDNSNREVDPDDIDNYRLTGASESQLPQLRERIDSGNFNLRRRLSVVTFPLALQVGGLQQYQVRNKRVETRNWAYNGPNGNPSAAPYVSQIYRHQETYFGFNSIEWASPRVAFEAWKQNPGLFTQTPAQVVTEARSSIQNSVYLKETVSAAYLQADAQFLQNRLKVLTGVRFERTADFGLGPLTEPSAVFQRNAAGEFIRNAAGARVRRPEAGAVGSLEELRITTREREARGDRSYSGYYPSIHTTYNITEELMVRVAFAKTYGRPDFDSVIPTTTINEFDVSNPDANVVGGSLDVANTGLRPWSANNYDLAIEYYTRDGGLLSAGAFLKDIKDFFGTETRSATREDLAELGLDPQYEGWTLRTRFNSGNARVSGAEFSLRQSLQRFGAWGRNVAVFVNGTRLRLEGNQAADFSSFMPKSLNWGISVSKRPITIMAKWNFRGRQRFAPVAAFGPGAFAYREPRTLLDLNIIWQLRPSLALVINGRNVFDREKLDLRYGPLTPNYARIFRVSEYGSQWAAGIKGSF